MQLKTLILSAAPNDFLGPVSFSEVFPTLKNLKIQTTIFIDSKPVPANEHDRMKVDVMNHIFDNTSQLECLVVQVDFIGRSTCMPLRVRECVFNSRASLKRPHLYYSVDDPGILREAIYDVLSAVQSQNIIEEINIIVFYCLAIWDPKIWSPTLELWSKLAKLLVEDMSLFPCLRKVHVKVLIMDPQYSYFDTGWRLDREDLKGYGKVIEREFSGLFSNPKIEFVGRVEIHNLSSYTFPEAPTF
ncbi:hypothetical protein BJ165DRAFT_187598 [Panaeolus papilionaceus]|nr:hypothetical protein BJ165DRAFT_187598 [Panaeolus papilionaceus]